MFENRKRRKQEELLKKLAMIKPTSKSELKQACLMLSNLDVDKAKKLYDFLVEGMTDIPDIPPAQKSFIQNFGEQANGVFGWIRENQDMLSQGYEIIKGVLGKRAAGKALPPINP